MTRVTAEQLAKARGCLLGLALGDAVGAADGGVPADGPLAATSAGQLACFTVEGVIRANVRQNHRGICHPPSVVWHAYTRWAALQGIPGIRPLGQERWPDGWLARMPQLTAGRGPAPATITALQGQVMGTVEAPATGSVGAHALTRTLPIGLLGCWRPEPGRFAAEVAATTHAAQAAEAAAVGAAIVSGLASGQGMEQAAEHGQRAVTDREPAEGSMLLAPVLRAAHSQPRRAAVLARLAPDARAASALAGGVYVAASFPARNQVRDALLFAASAGDGGHAATVAGALLGTAHGVDALPLDWVMRLELAQIVDTLAHDLVREFAGRPSGGGLFAAADPRWLDRYPGW